MNQPDYSFMKSGFNLAQNTAPDDIQKTIAAMVSVFGENALRNSAIFVNHAKRNVITKEDIKRALMFETFVYMKRPDILKKCQDMKEQLFKNSDSSEEEEYNSDELSDEPDEIFCESNCECSLCQYFNSIHDHWSKWTPKTILETSLKKHIDKIN